MTKFLISLAPVLFIGWLGVWADVEFSKIIAAMAFVVLAGALGEFIGHQH